MKSAAFLCCCFLSLVTAAAGTNLLQDAGFVQGFKGKNAAWKPYGGGKNNTIQFSSGTLTLADTMTDKAIGVRQDFPVEPGKKYCARVEVKAVPGHVGESFFVQVRLLPYKVIHQVAVKTESADRFQTVELAFSVPAKITGATLYFYSNPKTTASVVLRNPVVTEFSGPVANDMTPGDRKASLLKLPADCTVANLNKTPRPVVFLDAATNERARKNLAGTPHLQEYLVQKQAVVRQILTLSDEELRGLFPAPDTDIIYGLGLNSCPEGERLRWGGLKNPFQVLGKGDKLYPTDKMTAKQQHDYTARAHGFIYETMDVVLLPALADCYLLTGDQKYAHCAAVLMDRIAVNYCANLRGPLDYPTSSGDMLRGGRLQRPYYQVARGLMNYVHVFDAILPSGELDAPSVVKGRTMGENIIRDLLWDGAVYCLGFAYDGTKMHNGHVDYVRGPAAVGLLLNIPELAEPLFSDVLGVPAVMNTAVNREGLYTESSFMYSQHSIELDRYLALFYDSAVRQKWPGVKPIYGDPVFCSLMNRYADKLEVGGKIPMTGDDGPQMFVERPSLRVPARTNKVDRGLGRQLPGMWTLYAFGTPEQKADAAQFLRNVYGDDPLFVPNVRHLKWGITNQDLEAIRKLPLQKDFWYDSSNIFSSKGLALIRGGKGDDRHGFQLIFGPQLNHGQAEALSWTFYHQGAEWSYDQGYLNTHYRMGWTSVSVAHQQMVVDGGNAAVRNGGGELQAFLGNNPSGVQYVMAKQDHAFETSKRFERLLGQADHPETGKLEYWFDLGIVSGGKFRDDSFHTSMGRADFNQSFTSTGEHSLCGDGTKGMKVLPNFRLSGYPEKGFYWGLPGNGYGMLIGPALWKSGADLRGEYSQTVLRLQPGQKLDTLIADFPGEPDREYYTVKNMDTRVIRSVPYLIRRDRGDKTSYFAKVIHFRSESGFDPVKSVKQIPVTGDPEAKAYLVTLSDGRSDLWIAGTPGRTKTVAVIGYPEVVSQSRVTVTRFNAEKKAAFTGKSGASYTGTVRKVLDSVPGKIVFEVAWDRAPEKVLQGPVPVLTRSPGALPAGWTARKIDGNRIELAELRSFFSRCKLERIPGKDGLYRPRPNLVQLYTPHSKGPSHKIACGKFVCKDGQTLGIIADLVKDDAGEALLKMQDLQGRPLAGLHDRMVDLMETVPGCKVEVLHSTVTGR
ncbi:MAG: hypothetical protein J6S73_08565 [Lentisphaeria bacterium]|nr:hypothetical protein [Lentisphaeria bacterium]